ncbi:MAG: GPR endopeptidase [Ruminococcaceae bacterium]|nr:GPR endopeptidase [Oscillospiraceae bacterium]
MKKSSYDLIIEEKNAELSTSVHSPIHSKKTLAGYTVIESFSTGFSYNTIVCGRLSRLSRSNTARLSEAVFLSVSGYMKKLGLCRERRILFCGIGNPKLTADSLGPAVFEKIAVTGDSDVLPSVFAISPGIAAKTGIDSASVIRENAKLVRAELIVTADALSAASPERLCGVIQITDMGMKPGSAFSHSSSEISLSTMPCPIISVGVPTVIRSDILCGCDTSGEVLLVSPSDCDREIELYSSVIAGGLNRAFLGNDL